MSPQPLAPVLLFVYNRPTHTEKTIKALQNNHLAKQTSLYIFADGPKNKEDEIKTKEVKSCIRKAKGFKDITIKEQPHNIGLALSIIGGITSTLKKYDRIIVLEDDVVTSQHFLQYMNDALSFYYHNEKVMHVAAHMSEKLPKSFPETFFLKMTTSSGWGTWKRAWKYFKKDPLDLQKTFTPEMIYDFNLMGSIPLWDQVEKNITKEYDTWLIFWYACLYLNNGLSLNPRISMTNNIGMDGSGVHCGNYDYNVKIAKSRLVNFEKEIKLNHKVRQYLSQKHKRKKLLQPYTDVWKRIIRVSKRIIFERRLFPRVEECSKTLKKES